MNMLAYVDTSMLVKRYLPELGSEELEARLVAEQPELVVSELVQVELSSALHRRLREGFIDRSYFDDALEDFRQDIDRGDLRLIELDRACLHRAASLVRKLHAPIATLDALHLATALEHSCEIIFTNDAQLGRACASTGLACWPQAPKG
jgi:uncharacterized protein